MNKRKFEINLWPYVITATVIFAVFKMNGTIDWSWFKVLLPVIVYTVLAVVAALVIIALSLYKMKRDFKKTLEEQLAAADQRSDDRIAVAEKYRAACEELNKNWSRLSPEARTAQFERIRNLRELMNNTAEQRSDDRTHLAEILAARRKMAEEFSIERPAACNECKQKEL